MGLICAGCHLGEDINFLNPKVLQIHKRLAETVQHIDQLCSKHKASPADLPNPSYLAYQWLRFLSEKKWLLSHLHGLAEFQEIIRNMGNKSLSKINPANTHLEIKNFNYLFRIKQANKSVVLEINEGFISAPGEVKETLVLSAFSGRKSKRNLRLKTYSKCPEFRQISKALQADDHVNLISHQGHYFDLEKLFDALNLQYFAGELNRPRLVWSPRHSRRRLGYYHPEADSITISRSLDKESVPTLLIEYILYHEMLHKSLGIRETNGKRYAHTHEYKKAEKGFDQYNQAIALMKQFCQ